MQKLNFVLAFALAFFAGCTDTAEEAVDCGCAPPAAAAEVVEAPVAEVAPAAPAAEAVMSEAPAVEAAPVEVPAAAPVVESH